MMRFWGKARPSPGSVAEWHPLALHSLDVASVAAALLEAHPERAASVAAACGWPLRDWIRFVVFLVALHDLGKFSRAFQAKSELAWPADVLGAYRPAPGDPHDAVGMALWQQRPEVWPVLSPRFAQWNAGFVGMLLRAVIGHHGRPAAESGRSSLAPAVACGACKRAAGEFVGEMARLLDPPLLPSPQGRPRALALAGWWLAGLTVLCDWLGSSQRWFPYRGDRPLASLDAYWHDEALPQARRAVAASGLLACPVSAPRGITALCPEISLPSPLQALAERIELPEGPVCVLVEDVTGSGKTEAALVLAHRLMASGRADGLFVALPTMATADAMYQRLSHGYRRLFAGGEPSLVLAHGKAALNELFTGSILADAVPHEPAGPDAAPSEPAALDAADESASAQCAAWIADDRRLAFLAHVGIGTIDQALLGVLPARHAPLRLHGLARRVLVVDEAHACDAYMRAELGRLLEFHAALGGSAVILSATLPRSQRAELANAFLKGLEAPSVVLGKDDYPLLTSVHRAGKSEAHRGVRPELCRSVPVQRLASDAEAVALLVQASRAGACGAWVCNTVDRVLAAADALREAGVEPIVFHARYAMGDRLAIQEQVLAAVGKASEPADRAPGGRGRIVVATQVIEQSLDLDFDVLVSDLAPIDLMIQRAGRLWRHSGRERGVPAPLLRVIAPDPDGRVDAGWADMLGHAHLIYGVATLWRSARVLFATGAIQSPGDVRRLVEGVYGPDAESVPAALDQAENKALGKDICARGSAHAVLLELDKGYRSGQGMWDPDIHVSTRLDEGHVTLRLALEQDGRLVPICAHDDPARAWSLSEVGVAASKATGALVSPRHAAAVEAAKAAWPLWQRGWPLAVLQPARDGWVGELEKEGRRVPVRYDRVTGLRLA